MKASNIKKTISVTLGLVLISSSLAFAGCSEQIEEENIPQLPNYSAKAKDFDFFAYSGPMSGIFTLDGVTEDYNADQRTKEGYTTYKEAGFNVLMLTGTAGFGGGEWENSECQRCFENATAAGIDRILVTDDDIEKYVKTKPIVGEGCDFATQEDLVAYMKTVLEKYKPYSNFYGVRISDERSYEYTQAVGSLYRAIKQAAKELEISDNLYIHLNLLPISQGFERYAPYREEGDDPTTEVVECNNITDAYVAYVRGYLEACQADRLSSDVYLYRDKGLSPDFFPTIQILQRECAAYGAEVSFCLQSFEAYIGNNRIFRGISKSEMTGEISALIGMGVDHFAYYTYQVPEEWTSSEMRVDESTFLTKKGEKTTVYYAGQDVMSEAQAISDVILNYEYQGGKFYKKPVPTFTTSFTTSNPTMITENVSKSTSVEWDNSYEFKLLKDVAFDNDVAFVTELYDAENSLYMYMLQNMLDPMYGADGDTWGIVTATFDSSYTYVAEFENGRLNYVKLNNGVYSKTLSAGGAVYLVPLK